MNIFWNLCLFLGLFAPFSLAQQYDVLIFTQQWPKSTCINSRRPPARCNIPRNDDWTIHGIWPTKSLTSGPSNCRRIPFRIRDLNPIRRQLQTKWIDVLNTNPARFWEHEWERHGTCSVDLAQLNTQLKYFRQGLVWNTRYRIETILGSRRIRPGRSYPIGDIVRAITQGLGGLQPRVECFTDAANKQYLHEVKICFNKSLRLISCSGHVRSPSNCVPWRNVEYPSR